MKLKPLALLLLFLLMAFFPPSNVHSSQHTYRIYVIPVEFSDYPAFLYVDEVLEPIYEFADQYIPEVSYGRATVDLNYYPEWIELNETLEYYNSGEKAEELVRDALMALPESLEGYDVIIVVHAGDDELISGYEEDLKSASSFGKEVLNYSGGTISAGWALLSEMDWVAQIAHHVLHALGVPEAFSDGEDYADGWDPMGASYIDVDYPVHVNAATKLKLGWLYENETLRLDSGNVTVDLVGLSLDESGTKAVVIPISRTESYVIEARVFSGYDEDVPDEGVLIWLSTPHGTRLVDVHGTGNLEDAYLSEGESFVDEGRGVSVDVLSYDEGHGFRVYAQYNPPPPSGVVIDKAVFPHARLNVGEEAFVLLHAYKAPDGTPAAGYVVSVSGKEAEFNSTGWAELKFVSEEPKALKVEVEGVSYDDEPVSYTLNATLPTLTWDRILVESVEVDRQVADVGYSPEVKAYIYYESDHTPLSNGTVIVNGTELEYSNGCWHARMPASQQVDNVTYCLEAIEDHEYNITAVKYLDRCADFSWDRVSVEVESWHGDVSANATVHVRAAYELSGKPFDGEVYVNGTSVKAVGPGSYLLQLPTPGHVETLNLHVTGILDHRYNLTAYASKDGYAEWDAVKVLSFKASKRWADVGQPVRITAKLAYELSGKPFDGEVYVNGTKMSSLGPGEYYIDVSSEDAGTKSFMITGVEDNITTLTSSPKVEVGWDRVLITLNEPKTKFKPGQQAEISYEAIYESDGMPFTGKVKFNLPLVQDRPGTYEYTVKSIVDEERGITAFKSNAVNVTFAQPGQPKPQEQPAQTNMMLAAAAVAIAIAAAVIVFVKRR